MRAAATAILAATLSFPVAALAAEGALPLAQVPGSRIENSFLGADAKGRVFLLDAAVLAVYPVDPDGLGDPEPLELAGDPPRGSARSAAMGSREGDWLIQYRQDNILHFESGEQIKTPPAGWFVSTVAYVEGEPAVFVLPANIGHGQDVGKKGESPWLLTRSTSGWEVAVSLEMEEQVAKELAEVSAAGRESPLTYMRAHYAASFTGARGGGYWLADQHKFRIRRFARDSSTEDTLTLGDQSVEFVDLTEAESEDLAKLLAAKGHKGPLPKELGGRLRATVLDISEARDGRLFALVSADVLAADRERPHGDVALDRYDPLMLTYQRTELDLPDGSTGRMDIVAARDGIYVLAYVGGVSFISWEALEEADWREVEGIKLNQQDLSLLAPPVRGSDAASDP